MACQQRQISLSSLPCLHLLYKMRKDAETKTVPRLFSSCPQQQHQLNQQKCRDDKYQCDPKPDHRRADNHLAQITPRQLFTAVGNLFFGTFGELGRWSYQGIPSTFMLANVRPSSHSCELSDFFFRCSIACSFHGLDNEKTTPAGSGFDCLQRSLQISRYLVTSFAGNLVQRLRAGAVIQMAGDEMSGFDLIGCGFFRLTAVHAVPAAGMELTAGRRICRRRNRTFEDDTIHLNVGVRHRDCAEPVLWYRDEAGCGRYLPWSRSQPDCQGT